MRVPKEEEGDGAEQFLPKEPEHRLVLPVLTLATAPLVTSGR